MTTPEQINPAVAAPQAPRVLRVGSRGFARAVAAKLAGQPVPAAKEDDDEDDDDEDDEREKDSAGGEGNAKPEAGEADETAMAECADACRTASDACGRAQEQLDTCAAECEGGTDSVSTLTATETACDEAIEELQEAKAKCMALRGAEPETSPEPQPEPPPADARAIAKAAPAATAEAHLVTAKLAAFGSWALAQLGETDPARGRGALRAALDGAKQTEEATAKADTARLREAWSGAIRRGAYTAGQVWEQVEGKDGKRSSKFTAFAAKINARHPDVAELEAYLEKAPKLAAPRDRAADADTAGANAAAGSRLAADTMTAETAALAKRSGLDPAQLAANTALLFSHLAPGA